MTTPDAVAGGNEHPAGVTGLSEAVAQEHRGDAPAIIRAIAAQQAVAGRHSSAASAGPRYLQIPGIAAYQREIYRRFADVIDIPAFEYISKTPRSWLMVGDHRGEVAARVELIIERYGLGVGMLVLHAQQMHAQHILLELDIEGQKLNLAQATARLGGRRGENILYVPIRKYRGDRQRLAELNITKPPELWNRAALVTHEQVSNACNYCSAAEINPCEVVVRIEGARFGLSRNYELGFTFAPFGNPLSCVHFLAWHLAPGGRNARPLNMNRTPITFSDLVEMTRRINTSIAEFFAGTGIDDQPVIDGVSNGWAGNTIYHQHFQFFQPEYPCPIADAALRQPAPDGAEDVLESDDIRIRRLDWDTPVYEISADESINIGLVGNDMAGVWRLLGGTAVVPYRSFPEDYAPRPGELVPVHTQNLYVPGREGGRAAYILLRDKRRVDFRPEPGDYVNRAAGRRAQPKTNIAVLEASGTVIVDDQAAFEEMRGWSAGDITAQVRKMTAAIAPDEKKVRRFEQNIQGLFPS
ncbi:MAG TPA: hypothetical protein VGA61_15670 [Anaerolineae bacterium]